MESQTKQKLMDGVMGGLLLIGAPFDIGIPAWTLKQMTTRPTYAVPRRPLLGLDPEGAAHDVISEYINKRGYEFSWGTLSEHVYEDEEGNPVGVFEIFPKEVLMIFPQTSMVEDLFIWMYLHHPLRHPYFEGEVAHGDWFVMSFTAHRAEALEELRHWLATTFVTKVMPDLVTEAMTIATREILDAVGQGIPITKVFNERLRFQLSDDSEMLSFKKRRDSLEKDG